MKISIFQIRHHHLVEAELKNYTIVPVDGRSGDAHHKISGGI
jgi:hypothetical protein